MEAIQAILKHIINSKLKYNKATVIKIFTDSLTSIILILRYAHPKFYNPWYQVECIRNTIDAFKFYKPNIKKIILQKVKSHTNSSGNNKADILAKAALFNTKLNKKKYHQMPYAVARLHLKCMIGMNRIKIFHKRKNQNNFLFRFLKRPSKSLKELLFIMDRKISRNIIGILTSHNGLNFYKKRLNFKENNYGKCRFCRSDTETLSHIIFDCDKNPFLSSLYINLCNLSKFFFYIYKKKEIKGIILPSFNMVKPGKYMEQTLCLKIYKYVNKFMENVFNWKDENKIEKN